MAHIPVLLNEIVDALSPKLGDAVIDCTLGGGGHTRALADRVGPDGKVLALDLDVDAIERFWQHPDAEQYRDIVTTQQGNFADVVAIAQELDFPAANGLVVDLGFSSDQLDESGRGFSFLADEPLKMNYDQDTEMKAAHILNMSRERELAELIRKYSGERYARSIAREIVKERKNQRIVTVKHLTEVIRRAVPKNYERGRIDPATRTFQALRIAVNHELENLEHLLEDIETVLAPNGVIAIISFHSLEDRIVKHTFREKEKNGVLAIETKKPITASEEEIHSNPRSRSAKLRVAKKELS